MKKILPIFLFIFSYSSFFAQDETNDHSITLSTYVDGYYSGYNTEANGNTFRPYITVGARGNSIGVNVAQFGVNYEHKNVRSNLVLHYGDIPQATWSPDYNHIQEGNVGIKLSEGVWLDAGAFATHIGTESFLPKNNMLSSTAFKTYNEPFYIEFGKGVKSLIVTDLNGKIIKTIPARGSTNHTISLGGVAQGVYLL